MTAVRDRIITAHRRLDRWQQRMGVEAVVMGGGQDKPPGADAILPAEQRHLRVA